MLRSLSLLVSFVCFVVLLFGTFFYEIFLCMMEVGDGSDFVPAVVLLTGCQEREADKKRT